MKMKKYLLTLAAVCAVIFAGGLSASQQQLKAADDVQVEVVVQGPAGEIARGASETLKAREALDQVLADNGKAGAIVDGGMISSIDGLANAADWSSYWYMAVNRSNAYAEVNEGINDLLLKDGDRLLVYYSAYDTRTANKVSYSTTSPGKALTIGLNNEQLDWNTGSLVINPIISSTLKVWVDGQAVALDQNRIVLADGLKAGKHILTFSDYQQDPSTLPKVVADTLVFEIKNPTCNVRVEGLTDTMVQGRAQGENALDIVSSLLEDQGVSHTINSNYGGYITEIGGLSEKDLSSSTGWMFYVKNQQSILSPEVGMGSYIPEDGDELVLYFTDFTVPYVNGISFSPEIVAADTGFSMKFTYGFTDWSDWMNPVQAVQDIAGALVTIDDTNYITDSAGQINLPSGLPLGAHTYKISGYNSGRLSTVVMDQGTFLIDGAGSPSFNHSQASFESILDRNNLIINKDILGSIIETAVVVQPYSDPWAYLSLAKLGLTGDEEYLHAAFGEVLRYGAADFSNTELERLIFALAAKGYSPYDFAGENLAAELYGRDLNTFLVADVIYGILAMDYAGIGDNYGLTRGELTDRLLDMKTGSGTSTGWGLGNVLDPDLTGAALCALAPARGQVGVSSATVDEAVNAAVKSLAARVNESGYVVGQYGISSETNSFVILGLLAAGVNPEGITTLTDGTSVSFAKAKGDLVSALLSFKARGGAFRHVLEGGSNMMSTEQALRALISIGEYKSSGEAYNFYASGSHPGAFAVFQGTASVPVAVQPATGMASGSAKSEQAAALSELSELSADASPVQGASGAVATAPEAASSKKGYLLAGGILAGSGLIGGGAYLLLGRKRGLS